MSTINLRRLFFVFMLIVPTLAIADGRLEVQTGHSSTITALSFSPDGRLLASGGDDMSMVVWDVSSGRQIHKVLLPAYNHELDIPPSIDSVLFVNGGRAVAVWDSNQGEIEHHVHVFDLESQKDIYFGDASRSGLVQGGGLVATPEGVRDIQGGRLFRKPKLEWMVTGVSLSVDGHKFLAAGDAVEMFDAMTGGKLMTYPEGNGAYYPEISFDGRFVAALTETGAKIWDADRGNLVRSFIGSGKARFSPRGKHLIIDGPSHDTSTITIFEFESGREVYKFKGKLKSFPSAFVISPDEKRVAVALKNDSAVQLIDLSPEGSSKVFNANIGTVRDVAFSPDGRMMAVAGSDKGISLWEISTGRLVRILKGRTELFRDVAITPDGHYALTLSEVGALRLWDLEKGRVVRSLSASPKNTVDISADGHLAAVGGGAESVRTLQLLDLATGTSIALEMLKDEYAGYGKPAFSPDGRMVAWAVAGDGDRYGVFVWETTSRNRVAYLSEAKPPLAFFPDSRRLLSAHWGLEGISVVSWDVPSGKQSEIVKLPSSGMSEIFGSLFVGSDGRTAIAGCCYKEAMILDMDAGRVIATLHGSGSRHEAGIFAGALTSDIRMAATGSGDHLIKTWSVHKGTLLCDLKGFSNDVLAVSFSQNGRTVISGGADGTLRLWDADLCKLLTTIYSLPDGNWMSVGTNDEFETGDTAPDDFASWIDDDALMTPIPYTMITKKGPHKNLIPQMINRP